MMWRRRWTSGSRSKDRKGSDWWRVVAATDRNEGPVFCTPGDAWKLLLIKHHIMRHHIPVGFRIIALETLVTVLKPEVNASLGVPGRLLVSALLPLLHMDVGTAAKDPEHGKVRFVAMESLIGCLVLQVGRGEALRVRTSRGSASDQKALGNLAWASIAVIPSSRTRFFLSLMPFC